MISHWGFLILQSCYLVSSQNFNLPPLRESNLIGQTPPVLLPASFSPISVAEAFSSAIEIIANRRQFVGKKPPTLNAFRHMATARHHRFQGINPRARHSEMLQEKFELATKILVDRFKIPPGQVSSFGHAVVNLSSILPGNLVQKCRDQFMFNCPWDFPYRTFDGSCNNLQNPSWGMAATCFQRLLDPDYGDGTAKSRRAVSGNPLPLPRIISLEIHAHFDHPSHQVTHMFMVYGQFLDHDISLTPMATGPDNQPLDCCPNDPDNPPMCSPIIIPRDDPFFGRLNIDCLSNVRSSMCSTCSLGPRQQTNQLTSFIDCSQIYGLNRNDSSALRNLDGTGTLRSINSRYAGELLPPSFNPDEDFCSFQDPIFNCFETGDQRANLHPALTSMHTLFLREHNRIARILRKLNRGWSEEQLFQETRRILGAIMQVIAYKEYLPLAIGPEKMDHYELNIRRAAYTQYNPTVNPTLFNAFSAAAFRFGHSTINSLFHTGPGKHDWLRDIFQFPFGLYHGQMEGLVNGLVQTPSQKFDRHIVQDVTNHLYQNRGNVSGLDLISLNLLRARDHGVPSYTKFVEFCGGPRIKAWGQLDILFQKGLIPYFKRLYESVEDIDLFSGGLAERPNHGAVVGPTFTCIIGIQFYHLKYGDRFYFEHGGQVGSFSAAQLKELKKVTLAKLICQNSGVHRIQANVFLFPSHRNPVVHCEDLPELDLRLFSEKRY